MNETSLGADGSDHKPDVDDLPPSAGACPTVLCASDTAWGLQLAGSCGYLRPLPMALPSQLNSSDALLCTTSHTPLLMSQHRPPQDWLTWEVPLPAVLTTALHVLLGLSLVPACS